MNEKILEVLENIQKRLANLEDKQRIVLRKLQDMQTMATRTNTQFKEGIAACQKAFMMGASAQYEMREELSDYAGNCTDFENDIGFNTLKV
jgi:hypothetical protein